jgi:hypothetical protein
VALPWGALAAYSTADPGEVSEVVAVEVAKHPIGHSLDERAAPRVNVEVQRVVGLLHCLGVKMEWSSREFGASAKTHRPTRDQVSHLEQMVPICWASEVNLGIAC